MTRFALKLLGLAIFILVLFAGCMGLLWTQTTSSELFKLFVTIVLTSSGAFFTKVLYDLYTREDGISKALAPARASRGDEINEAVRKRKDAMLHFHRWHQIVRGNRADHPEYVQAIQSLADATLILKKTIWNSKIILGTDTYTKVEKLVEELCTLPPTKYESEGILQDEIERIQIEITEALSIK